MASPISTPSVLSAPTWRDGFSYFASWSADLLGSPVAFAVSALATLVWALSGPLFNYSDTWQLVVNTATTVLTFLAVFLIQHTQNREGRAMQLKLDELIRSSKDARNRLIDLEHCTDEELKRVQDEFARRGRRTGHEDTSTLSQVSGDT
jgi:low affinity Fe/Cu permease